MLRQGKLDVSDVPVTYIERNGTRLIENTRASLALKRVNIPQLQWKLINKTGNLEVELKITERLQQNGLSNIRTDALGITGQGKNASSLR